MNDQKTLMVVRETRALLETPETLTSLERMAGRRMANKIIGGLMTAIQQTPALTECTPASLMLVGIRAASVGIPLDPALGLAYAVPRRVKGIWTAQFQIGYKGLRQLALKTGKYAALNVGPLYEGETFAVDRLSGTPSIAGQKQSEKVIGYFAYLKMTNGREAGEYMTIAEIEAHRDRYSPKWDRTGSAWKTHPEAMMKKTVLAKLLREYGEFDLGGLGADGDPEHTDPEPDPDPDGEIIEGEIMDADPELDPAPKFRAEFAEVRNANGVLYNAMTVEQLEKVASGLFQALQLYPGNAPLKLKLDAANYYLYQKRA